jgi:hypothetical protein
VNEHEEEDDRLGAWVGQDGPAQLGLPLFFFSCTFFFSVLKLLQHNLVQTGVNQAQKIGNKIFLKTSFEKEHFGTILVPK